MPKVRDEKTKKAFIEYLEAHPQERFWQSVRNFWRVAFVYISDSMLDGKDTFYIEGDEEINEKIRQK